MYQEEFQTVTNQMQNKTSIQLSMDDYEKFIKSYDTNSDGKIDYGVCIILVYLVLVLVPRKNFLANE